MFQLDLARVISSFKGVKIRILVPLHNAKPEDAVQKLIAQETTFEISKNLCKPNLQTS
jgi:hypothetical protein